MSERRILVFAGGRADLWPLSSVLRAFSGRPATLALLVPEPVAATLGELAAVESLEIIQTPAMPAEEDHPGELVAALARAATSSSDAIDRWRPDLFVVLGDRFELLGACGAALLHGVPIAHLHGGEVTEGAIDDSIRHAITKLAHLHLPATRDYGSRIESMGEEPWRIHVTGESTIDRLRPDAEACPLHELETVVGGPLVRPVALMTYHAPTLEPEALDIELEAIIRALEGMGTVIATYPGADRGAAAIIDRLRRWEQECANVRLVPSLGRVYARALAESDVVVGNSSSGIVEAPTFGVPVVNVGDRQLGRIRWPGIIDVPGDDLAVAAAVARALDPSFRAAVAQVENLYGDGRSADRVVDVLLSADLGQLLRKRFYETNRTTRPSV